MVIILLHLSVLKKDLKTYFIKTIHYTLDYNLQEFSIREIKTFFIIFKVLFTCDF